MNRKLLAATALLVVQTMVLAACEQSETSPEAGGTVKASPAYVKHFGQPPTPEEGICFARVGFFPLRSDPAKVRAVPFFLFRQNGQLEQLLERLASAEVPLPPDSGMFNPFPEGTRVGVQKQDDNSVTLNMGFAEQTNAEQNLEAIISALTETAVQFEGTESVVILRDGKPLPGAPVGGYQHDPGRVAAVQDPALFMVIASWEEGEDDPEEIAANFDRPVKIESFTLEDAEGRKIRGDYFQSVFNMSVIIHPENAGSIREGMALRARWEVVDDLGRKGTGSGEFKLQRHEHPLSESG